MNLAETLRVALGSLTSNKMRSSLTMLGIIIGVGAVISLMSVGQGAQASITNQIKGMGSNLLFVSPGATQSGGVRSAAGSAATLTYEDAEAIAENVPQVAAVAPESGFFGQVIAGGNNVNTRITGATPDYEVVRNWHVSDGQFITREQLDGASLVALLGSNVAFTLFPSGDAVGQQVNIGFANNRRMQFRVVGVLESKGAQAMGNQDDTILIPLT
ncbi:MAG: ABC transporter permease, partial [Chloroflexota bacterium]